MKWVTVFLGALLALKIVWMIVLPIPEIVARLQGRDIKPAGGVSLMPMVEVVLVPLIFLSAVLTREDQVWMSSRCILLIAVSAVVGGYAVLWVTSFLLRR